MKTHWTGVVVSRITWGSLINRFSIGNATAWLRLKTACAPRLLLLLLLLIQPAEVQALDYTYTTTNGTITITKYTGPDGSVTIPGTIDGLPVTSIGNGAFFRCTNLTSATIPNSVTNIGNGAFGSCSNLASITIPNSVTSIGFWAFSNCTSLAAITVDALNSAYSSEDGVLFNKSQTTLIGYPAGKAGSYAIPNSVISIGFWAFYLCTGLSSVTIPNSVTNIGNGAFWSCTSLTNVTIPNSITSIEYGVFSSCTGLSSVTIPNSVTNIGIGAFWSCTSLTIVYFKGNAPSVNSSAFFGAPNATVYYLAGTTGWGPTFAGRPTVLWNPQAQTSGASFGVQTNRFGFTITGISGTVIEVEACTDLANPTWLPLQTNTLSGDSFFFSDPRWTNHPARFYRLRSP